jgi:DNA polymerase elongation subunit (family B)
LKDVLDYTEEELLDLSIDELEILLKEAENGELLWNTRQMTEKILMNALYGAMSNKYFPLFNEEMAAAITGNGRYFIQKKSNYIEERLQSLISSKKPYIIYNDTDAFYVQSEIHNTKYNELDNITPGLYAMAKNMPIP